MIKYKTNIIILSKNTRGNVRINDIIIRVNNINEVILHFKHLVGSGNERKRYQRLESEMVKRKKGTK